MKNNFLFWLIFILTGGLVFSGNVLWQEFQKEKPQTNNVKQVEQKESDCIDRLINDVKPLLVDINCDNYIFNVPKHWYLNHNGVCDGQITSGIIPNVKGLSDYKLRKDVWKGLIIQMTYLFSGVEKSQFGSQFEDYLNRFQAALKIFEVASGAIHIAGGALQYIPTGNSVKLFIFFPRNSTGKFIRDEILQLNKYTTYANTFKILGNNLIALQKNGKIASDLSSIIDVKKITSDYLEIDLTKENSELLFASAHVQELVKEITDRIIFRKNQGESFDPALIDVCNEFETKNEDCFYNLLKDYIENKGRKNIIEIDKTALLLLTGVVNPPAAIIFGLILTGSEVIQAELFSKDSPYYYPFFYSVLAYSLAQKDFGKDSYGLFIKSLSLLTADKQIYSYFDGEFLKGYRNLLAWNNPIGNQWHDLVYNEKRNQELNYLIYGYYNDGEPCNSCLKGRVVDDNSSVPIEGAFVSVFNKKDILFKYDTKLYSNYFQLKPNATAFNTKSDYNGFFYIKIIEDGTYIIRTSKSEYCTRIDSIHIKNGMQVDYPDIINIRLVKPSNKLPSDPIALQKYYAYSSGTGIKIGVELTNELCKDIKHKLPYGTTFRNGNTYHQNILLAKEYELTAFANSKTKYELPGYCISRFRMGVDGDLTLDNSLSKDEYTTLTKIADNNDYHEKKYGDVQNAVWHFSDNVGVEKGGVADDLVKKTQEIVPQNKQNLSNKIGLPSSLGALLSTVIISLPLYGFLKKRLK